jgi:long-chain fatty acid transport protein
MLNTTKIMGGIIASFVVFALACNNVKADGFAIKDQSPSGAGTSFASSTSTAEDASVIFYNPAGLAHLSGSNILFGAAAIAPVNKLKSSSGTFPALLGGGPTGGASTEDDVTPDAIIPVIYGQWDYSPDLKFGFGLNAPFGLSSSYAPTWLGRFHAVTTKLKTINFNPTAAYRLSDKLSVGGGFQIAYAQSRLANAISTTTGEGFIDVDGDDFGLGWTIGVLVEPWKGTRFGVSYRSDIDHVLDGSGRVTPGVGAPVDVSIEAGLHLPETVRFGFSQDIKPNLSLHLGAAWRRWSRVEERRVNFDAPVAILGGASSIATNADWKNTWYLAAGAIYKPTKKLILRIGAAYDESPVPDSTRGPSIPLGDGASISFGATYKVLENFDITAAYVHIFQDDATVSLINPATGNLSAEFEAHTDVFAVQGWVRF